MSTTCVPVAAGPGSRPAAGRPEALVEVDGRLLAVHAAQRAATDDATLVELVGEQVQVVPGAEEAFKVTRPIDLALAGVLLAAGAR